jgi:hypothetical protein
MMGAVKMRGDAEIAHLRRGGRRRGGRVSLERVPTYMLNSVLNSSSVMFWGRSLALAHCPLHPGGMVKCYRESARQAELGLPVSSMSMSFQPYLRSDVVGALMTGETINSRPARVFRWNGCRLRDNRLGAVPVAGVIPAHAPTLQQSQTRAAGACEQTETKRNLR